MMAVRTIAARSRDCPTACKRLRLGIEAAVPHGGIGLKGGWKDGVPTSVGRRFATAGSTQGLKELEDKHPPRSAKPKA